MKKNLAIVSVMLMLLLALAGCGKESGTNDGPNSAPSAPSNETSQPTAEPTEKPDGGDHVVDYKLDIPEDFAEVELEGVTKCWFRASDNSNINMLVSDKVTGTDVSFQLISADLLRETVVEQMKQSYGAEPTITERYFTKEKVSGLDAYQYSYDMDLDGTQMSQIIVCINADQTYTFTYTTSDADTLAVFDASAKNIQLTLG